MGVYSEWDEDKKLEFLTRELKGKRPLIPPSIEVNISKQSKFSKDLVFRLPHKLAH